MVGGRQGCSSPSENAFLLERLPHCDKFWVVDQQKRDGDAAYLTERFQLSPVPAEVRRPIVASRMKQTHDFAAVNAREVRALETIAVNAGESEIIEGGLSAMLPGDNVVDLEWSGLEVRGQVAIFTASLGSLPNLLDKISVHVVDGVERCKARRPLDCITASRFPTWI